MTLEQKHAAQDILATLISFDCTGIDCYNCPFSYNNGSCMVTTASRKFDELNSTTEQLNRVYADTDSIKLTEKGDN